MSSKDPKPSGQLGTGTFRSTAPSQLVDHRAKPIKGPTAPPFSSYVVSKDGPIALCGLGPGALPPPITRLSPSAPSPVDLDALMNRAEGLKAQIVQAAQMSANESREQVAAASRQLGARLDGLAEQLQAGLLHVESLMGARHEWSQRHQDLNGQLLKAEAERDRLLADNKRLSDRVTQLMSQASTRDRANLSSLHEAVNRRLLQLHDNDFHPFADRLAQGHEPQATPIERARLRCRIKGGLAKDVIVALANRLVQSGPGLAEADVQLARKNDRPLLSGEWFGSMGLRSTPPLLAQFNELYEKALEWAAEFARASAEAPGRLIVPMEGARFDPQWHEAERHCSESREAIVHFTSFPGLAVSPPARVLSKPKVSTFAFE